jgi:HD-like signal output (HDOD) protein
MEESAKPQRSRILFVDDEQSILDGLRRSLSRLRGRWEMAFLSSPKEAAKLVAEQDFDVVVADMRMPKMSGAELLEHVREVSPASVRFMLSGHSEVSAIMKTVGPSHQFLSKPCNSEVLEAAIQRACSLRSALADPKLAALLGRIQALPSLPSVYSELVAALRSEVSMDEIGDIIRRDVGLTVKVLQLVNSSYFGSPREVTDPARAAMLLGSDNLCSLVLGLKLFDSLPPVVLPKITPQQLVSDAMGTAAATRQICILERVNDVFLSQAFIAAFLHDVGLLTLAAYAPELLKKVGELVHHGMCLSDAEVTAIGATHGGVGAYLTGLWGFPDPVVEAILHHHSPLDAACTALSPLTIVHVTQALTRSREGKSSKLDIDEAYLTRVGVHERLPSWIEAVEDLAPIS